jgi:hypothetical protein
MWITTVPCARAFLKPCGGRARPQIRLPRSWSNSTSGDPWPWPPASKPRCMPRSAARLPQVPVFPGGPACVWIPSPAGWSAHPGQVSVISAGNCPILPVAERSRPHAGAFLGFQVKRLWDVGGGRDPSAAAQPGRPLQADVLIVVAGMEGGPWASVVGGSGRIVPGDRCAPPALATGASFQGLAAPAHDAQTPAQRGVGSAEH